MFQRPAVAPPVYPQPAMNPSMGLGPKAPMPVAPMLGAPTTYPTPYGWQAAPASSPVLAAQAPGVAQPKVRGYAPEIPATPPKLTIPTPRTLALPTPEDLGLGRHASTSPETPSQPSPTPSEVDWNQTHARLRQLRALGIHVDRLANGMTRVTVLMPSGQTGQHRRIETNASSEGQAVASALSQAEQVAVANP